MSNENFFEYLKGKVQTGLFDLIHASKYLTSGSPQHEGRFEEGVWYNWSESYQVRPQHYHCPESIEELSEIVAKAQKVRVVGGGHSFNDSPLCTDTLISLDKLNKILSIDLEKRRIRVQTGIRLRDLNRFLWAEGLGLPVLGSTDTQSLGGLIATDLHGTGRWHGFLAEQILSLTLVGADGSIQELSPDMPLFHATCGAIGSCGVVAAVEIELVPAFNLVKTTQMVDRVEAEAQIENLIAKNDHISFYYIAGNTDSESVRLHTWNHTTEPVTEDWEHKKVMIELNDFAISAFVPQAAEWIAAMDENAGLSNLLAPDHRLVMPGRDGFGRKLFYRHDEIEYGIPFEHWQACLAKIMELLQKRSYFSVVEVRFTPNQCQSLIGPGAGRRTAYIELATPLSQDVTDVYAEVEQIFLSYQGQPHLGKKTNITASQMAELHQERFQVFQQMRQQQDPTGKFLNEFAQRVLIIKQDKGPHA
jgi:L-gulonolactone oxidase